MEQVLLLEQTIDYCKSLLPQLCTKAADNKEIEHDLPKGTAVMASKKERGDEMYFNATKGKKGKKGMKLLPQLHDQNDPEHAQKVMQKQNAKSIKHTAESLTVFKGLGVGTPMVVSDYQTS